MKLKTRLFLLLILTALIFTLVNPLWRWLDILKSHPSTGNDIDLLFNWAESAVAIMAFSVIIALLAPAFSRLFLGYESKKPDEGDEVFFYVVLTLFVLGLGLIGVQLTLPKADQNQQKDMKYLCQILDQYDLDLTDATADKLDAICADSEDKDETHEKSDTAGKIQIKLPMRRE